MQLSAEVRWFWPELLPTQLEEWYRAAGNHDGVLPGGGATRVDVYLRDDQQEELGLKNRGQKAGVEVKGLVEEGRVDLDVGPFRGPIQIWCKWTSERLTLEGKATVSLEKRRWLRKFDGGASLLEEIPLDENESGARRPDRGCNVELTRVLVDPPSGQLWWTLGLESFGTLATVHEDLRRTAELLARRNCPGLDSGTQASYPKWLTTCLVARSSPPAEGTPVPSGP